MAGRRPYFISLVLFCILVKQSNACFYYSSWYSYSWSSWYSSYSYSHYSWYWSSESYSYFNYDGDTEGGISQLYETDTFIQRDYCNGTLDFKRVTFQERTLQATEGNEFCKLRVVTHDDFLPELEILDVDESVSKYLFVEYLKSSSRQANDNEYVTLDVDLNPNPQYVLFDQPEVVLYVRAAATFKIKEIEREGDSTTCEDGGQHEVLPGINETIRICNNKTHNCNYSQICKWSDEECANRSERSNTTNVTTMMNATNTSLCVKHVFCNETETCVKHEVEVDNRSRCELSIYAGVLFCSTIAQQNASSWIHPEFTACTRPCPADCICSISYGKIVSNCGIGNVSSTLIVYPNVTRILHLDLRNNALQFIDESTFKDVVNLEVLDISDNSLVSINLEIFRPITKLVRLIAENNKLSDVNNSTRHLPKLVVVDLSHNSLRRLVPGEFLGQSSLQTLDLSENKLVAVQKNVFYGIQNLTRLNLAYNTIIELETQVFDRILGPGCNVKFLTCEIDISFNYIQSLPVDIFQRLNHNHGMNRVNKLILSNNRLSLLQRNTFQGLKFLSLLDLSHNYLVTILASTFNRSFHDDCNDMYFIGIICTLDMSYNDITELMPNAFGTENKLTRFDLSHNSLPVIAPGTFVGLDYLYILNLAHNMLQNVAEDSFKGLLYLHKLDLSHNFMTIIPTRAFEGTLSLGCAVFICELDISFNELQSVEPDAFEGLWYLMTLNLSSNNLPTLEHNAFNGLSMFCKIDTSNNVPGDQIDINWKTVCSGSTYLRMASHHVQMEETADNFNGLCKLQFSIQTTPKELEKEYGLQLEVLDADERDLQYMFLEFENSRDQLVCTNRRTMSIHEVSNECHLHLDTESVTLSLRATKVTLVVSEIVKNITESKTRCLCGEVCQGGKEFQRCATSDHESVRFCSPMPSSGVNAYVGEFGDIRMLSCAKPCMDECRCSIGQQELLSECGSTNKSVLIIYPSFRQQSGLSFAGSRVHVVHKRAFVGLTELLLLDLSNNHMERIESTVFVDLPRLQYLLLSENKLVELTSEMFAGSTMLSHLNLSHNDIAVLQSDAFLGLASLQILDISSNQLTSVQQYDFRGLEDVQILDVSGNYITRVYFGKLLVLQRLDLSFNNITTLERNAFPELPALEFLSLKGGPDLTALIPGCFESLNRLKQIEWKLNVNHLYAFTFSGLMNVVSFDFNHIMLETMKADTFNGMSMLKSLSLNDNLLKEILSGTFNGLPNLRYLTLRDNRLIKIYRKAFNGAPALSKLDLSGNRLNVVQAWSFLGLGSLVDFKWELNVTVIIKDLFKGLGSLQELDLSWHGLETLETGAFNGLVSLTSLSLKANVIQELRPNTFPALQELEVIDLRKNRIARIEAGAFNGLRKIKNLDLSKQHVAELQMGSFDGLHSLTSLNLSGNKLSALLTKMFQTLRLLVILNMSSNAIAKIESSAFFGLENLEFLFIKNNNLKDIGQDAFAGLVEVKELDLFLQSINKIRSDQFKGLDNLGRLNLSSNVIADLERFAFAGMANLSVLDLSQNRLKTLLKQTFAGLTKLQRLYIQENMIASIRGDIFVSLESLMLLNLSSNALDRIAERSFSGLRERTDIFVDDYITCCYVRKSRCHSPNASPSVFLSCRRILASVGIRFYMWFFSLCVFGGNGFALYWILKRTAIDNRAHLTLICNLIIANTLMGIYMLFIASADAHFGDLFPFHSNEWRNSFGCHFGSFLFIIANKASIFIVAVISIERYIGMRYSFNKEQILSVRDVVKLLVCMWIVIIMMGGIPVTVAAVGTLDLSEKCITLPLARDLISGAFTAGNGSFIGSAVQEPTVGMYYSIVTFVGVDIACLLIIIITYLHGFIALDADTNQQCNLEELKSTYKQAVVALLDVIGWLSIIVIVISFQKSVTPVKPYEFDTVLLSILCLNSYINPVLHVMASILLDRWSRGKDLSMNVTLDNVGESAL